MLDPRSQKMGQDRERWWQDRVKIVEESENVVKHIVKTTFLRNSGPQDGPKMAPRWPLDGQDRVKIVEDAKML